jgi:hypothetical protein
MTDEERQRQMDFIIEQQAQFTVNIQKLEENMQKLEENMQKLEESDVRAAKRLDRLERVLKLAIRAGLRERKETRQSFKETNKSIKALVDSQAHTDKRLDALIDVVNQGRNGKSSLES